MAKLRFRDEANHRSILRIELTLAHDTRCPDFGRAGAPQAPHARSAAGLASSEAVATIPFTATNASARSTTGGAADITRQDSGHVGAAQRRRGSGRRGSGPDFADPVDRQRIRATCRSRQREIENIERVGARLPCGGYRFEWGPDPAINAEHCPSAWNPAALVAQIKRFQGFHTPLATHPCSCRVSVGWQTTQDRPSWPKVTAPTYDK